MASELIHVGRRVVGIGSVDFASGVLQLGRELDGKLLRAWYANCFISSVAVSGRARSLILGHLSLSPWETHYERATPPLNHVRSDGRLRLHVGGRSGRRTGAGASQRHHR